MLFWFQPMKSKTNPFRQSNPVVVRLTSDHTHRPHPPLQLYKPQAPPPPNLSYTRNRRRVQEAVVALRQVKN